MSDEEINVIALAIKSLEKAINKILKRRDSGANDKSHSRIQRLVAHARHLFIQLLKKRRSLKSFLPWFQREWIRIEVDLENHPVEILQHSMQHFLRCQDAFILLTSGECRHEYDTKLAKTTDFRSRLSTLQERDDGYTTLYKNTSTYSGYGFDEYNNEIVGIRALLGKELKRYHKTPWDYVERHGGIDLLESLLDNHEREAKEMQLSLQSLKRRMLEDISKRLAPQNLKFATQDKMERLSLSVNGKKIDLQRRAESFQIEGPLLPDKNRKPEDWNSCSLTFHDKKKEASPISKKQKKRRVIDDSDSDDEMISDNNARKSKDNLEQTAGKSSGLVVRIESSRPKTEKEDSLAVIKNQLGINSYDLEQSREILEGEDANTKRIFEQEKVIRLENILKRVLSRHEVDENEVWDARECLRYAYMEAGNKYLWDSRIGCVDRAIDNFEKAKQIVEIQQKSQKDLSNGDTASLIHLNLIYLQAQAIVNIGISLIDSCNRKMTTSKAKVSRAIDELKSALSLMEKLRKLAEKSGKLSSNVTESISYVLKSKQLESLARRWMGRGFWMISQQKKAIAAFEKASEIFNDAMLKKWHTNSDFQDDILEVAAEAIYSTCDLADRCNSRIENYEYQSSLSREKDNEMLETANRALTRHIEISESIERYYCSFRAKHFRVEYDISSVDDVRSYRDEIIRRWKDRSNKESGGALSAKDHGHFPLKRSELLTPSTNVMQASNQKQINPIFSTDRSKKRRYQSQQKGSNGTKRNRENNDYGYSTSIDAVHALSNESLLHQPRPPIKYRKWGDEILIAQQQEAKAKDSNGAISGESCTSSLVLAYPSIAPPIPIEFQLTSNS